jgi:MinD-like ATPase involved in chromosome partitioning or flagellar assembly
MFVATFYSFRGGVGRTMAIVNIGTWLARHGRRVLLVDFDLEAPGIPHYALPNAKAERKGVVDYLFEMSEGSASSSIEDYYFESFVDKGGGRLYVMPAGRASTHVARLEQLNLSKLYESGDGYLVLENLKALWQRDITPDYVLIDSRTGYNEVAGICTRQLPDAVVAAFIPSPQNVNGLKEVVSQIRAQNSEKWRPEIQLHFLASSIPSIDDEDGAIADAIEMSKQVLEFKELLGRVYYIPSAAHLKQTVFTLEKESSRLAKNFAEVARALTMVNPADPEGARNYLDRVLRRDHDLMRSLASARLDNDLTAIAKQHGGNPGVVFRLARVRLRQGNVEEAIALLTLLLETDPNESEARLLRATLYAQRDEGELAERDLREVLSRTDLDVIQVHRAVRALIDIAPTALPELHNYPAYAALDSDGRAFLLTEIGHSHVGATAQVIADLEALNIEQLSTPDLRDRVTGAITLHRIHTRDFNGVMSSIGARPGVGASAPDLFNYAIAEWGATGEVPADLFRHLLEKEKKDSSPGANRMQCFAIAHAALGDYQEARRLLESAKNHAVRESRPEFSAWTYSTVGVTEFVAHIDEMLGQLAKNSLTPRIVARAN